MLKRTAVSANEAILIGDEVRDGEAAKKAGIAFGAVAWGFMRIETLASQTPDAVFMTPADMLKTLQTGPSR